MNENTKLKRSIIDFSNYVQKHVCIFNLQQTNKPTNKQTNKPTNQQTNKPTKQQTNKQTNKPTNQTINKPYFQRNLGKTQVSHAESYGIVGRTSNEKEDQIRELILKVAILEKENLRKVNK